MEPLPIARSEKGDERIRPRDRRPKVVAHSPQVRRAVLSDRRPVGRLVLVEEKGPGPQAERFEDERVRVVQRLGPALHDDMFARPNMQTLSEHHSGHLASARVRRWRGPHWRDNRGGLLEPVVARNAEVVA